MKFLRFFFLCVVIIGISSICNDTRGARWLAFPGLLAFIPLVWLNKRQKKERR